MLNINDLEKRWLEYKIRSIAPYIVGFLTIIFVSVAGYFFFSSKKEIQKPSPKETIKSIPVKQKQPQKQEIKTIKKIEVSKVKEIPQEQKVIKTKKDVIKPIIIKELPQQVEEKTIKNKVIIKPSMRFLQDFENDSAYNKSKQRKIKKAKVQKIAPINLPIEEYVPQKKVLVEHSKTKPVIKKEKENTVKISIKRRESENDIKEVLARFQQNNNPALSLFAAKKYYELGNYKQAYNYALITNKINNDIEESWLIFAKALVKLGKRGQAVRTLQKYINYSHSSNAQILLDEIQRGKFQ